MFKFLNMDVFLEGQRDITSLSVQLDQKKTPLQTLEHMLLQYFASNMKIIGMLKTRVNLSPQTKNM